MPYIVIKTIKGRQYRYQQRSYRQGGQVRTETIYLGPVGGGTRRKGVLRRIGEFIELNLKRDGPSIDEEAVVREVEKQDAERERTKQEFYSRTGLRFGDRNPTPIDKLVPEISLAQEAPSEVADGAKNQ